MSKPMRQNPAIMVPPPAEMGAMMRKLSPQHRAFVEAKLQDPHCTNQRAAMVAGYTGTLESMEAIGCKLARDPRIVDAIKQETVLRISTLLPLALDRVEQMLRDETIPGTTVLKAAQIIFDRGGAPVQTEQKIEVERKESTGEQVERIVNLAKQLGIDPQQLLGRYGVKVTAAPVIDMETHSTEGLEDVL